MNNDYKLRKHLFPKLLLFLFLTVSFHAFGQVVFEQGYFIDNNNKKTECLIKNAEWKNSPTQIEYRLTELTEPKTATIKDIKEFQVADLKYLRFTVLIDQSSVAHSNLSTVREPIFREETVFLKPIIEGAASLYESGKDQRYFYTVDTFAIAQLIHKEYIFENRVNTNNTYKSQLWADLKCDDISVKDIDEIAYSKKALKKIFGKYNTCVGSDFINYEKNKRKYDFNLTIRPGLRMCWLYVENSVNQSQFVDFEPKASFSIGIEAELVLPFNKNKWSVITEPTYQSYDAEDPRAYYSNTVDYQSIEVPLGVKYNMFLSDKSNLFLTASFILIDIPINSSIGSLEVNSLRNLIFGFGYRYNAKFSAAIRYGTPRNLLGGYVYYISKYQTLSFVIGYNLF